MLLCYIELAPMDLNSLMALTWIVSNEASVLLYRIVFNGHVSMPIQL